MRVEYCSARAKKVSRPAGTIAHVTIDNAAKLKDYMGCIQQSYPGAKVDILTHSMGSLQARRYIIDNPTDNHVQRLITIGAPWLGAPKLVYYLAPNFEHRSWKWISPGSFLGSLMWLALSGLFALYTAFSSSYDRTYGSLAGAIVPDGLNP